MTKIVTLKLSETIAQRAKEIAVLTHRRLEDVLVEWLDRAITEIPVESLPDEQVLALCNMQMETEQQGNRSGGAPAAHHPKRSLSVNIFQNEA